MSGVSNNGQVAITSYFDLYASVSRKRYEIVQSYY